MGNDSTARRSKPRLGSDSVNKQKEDKLPLQADSSNAHQFMRAKHSFLIAGVQPGNMNERCLHSVRGRQRVSRIRTVWSVLFAHLRRACIRQSTSCRSLSAHACHDPTRRLSGQYFRSGHTLTVVLCESMSHFPPLKIPTVSRRCGRRAVAFWQRFNVPLAGVRNPVLDPFYQLLVRSTAVVSSLLAPQVPFYWVKDPSKRKPCEGRRGEDTQSD